MKARVWERRWRQANKAKIRAYEHTRRALETGAGRANPIVIAAILEARVCYYCGCELVRQKAPHSRKGTIDHRTPLSRGGTNDASNLSAACASCNFSKNDLTEEEFRAGTRRKTKGRPEAA